MSLANRVVKKIGELESNLHSGDEARIIEFLQIEVEPLFDQLSEFDESVKERVEAYRAALDPELGLIYNPAEGL